jgi:hypothetical protein
LICLKTRDLPDTGCSGHHRAGDASNGETAPIEKRCYVLRVNERGIAWLEKGQGIARRRTLRQSRSGTAAHGSLDPPLADKTMEQAVLKNSISSIRLTGSFLDHEGARDKRDKQNPFKLHTNISN